MAHADDEDRRLDGKVAVVTGAGSGMGLAMARSLAAAGAKIAAVDIDAARLSRLAGEAVFQANGLLPVTADIARDAECTRAVAAVLAAFGTVDILVNCAGVSMGPASPAEPRGQLPFWEIDPAGWEAIQAINCNGAFFMARAVVPILKAKGWGRIINVTTSLATMLTAGLSAYGASKAGLEAASVVWAKELDGSGVTVNVLLPGGMTDTPFLPPDVPRAGLLKPDVMAAPVRWLASDASDGITGRRFVARSWDTALPPAEAAARTGARAAWPEEAAREAARHDTSGPKG